MKCNSMLFLGLFFAQPICAMEKNSQVALTSEFARRFVQAAQEDWNEETKALLKHSNSNAAQFLTAIRNYLLKEQINSAKREN